MLILDVEPFAANAAENPAIMITATAARNLSTLPSLLPPFLPVLPFLPRPRYGS